MKIKRYKYFSPKCTSWYKYIYAYFFDKTDFYPELAIFFTIATYLLVSYQYTKGLLINGNNVSLNTISYVIIS